MTPLPFQTYVPSTRRRIEPRLSKLDALIDQITEVDRLHNEGKIDELINNRRYLIATILEQYGTWRKEGDCLPTLIKLGRFGDSYIKVDIINEEEASQ